MSYENIEEQEKEYGVGQSAFYKLQIGANRVRIVSEPGFLPQHWNNQIADYCPGIHGNCEQCARAMAAPEDAAKKLRAQIRYCFLAIDRIDGIVKIVQFPKSIYNEIKELKKSSDYHWETKEMPYDITITKKKTGEHPMNVKYSILPGKETALTEEEKAQIAKARTVEQYIEGIKNKSKEEKNVKDTMDDIINDVPFQD